MTTKHWKMLGAVVGVFLLAMIVGALIPDKPSHSYPPQMCGHDSIQEPFCARHLEK